MNVVARICYLRLGFAGGHVAAINVVIIVGDLDSARGVTRLSVCHDMLEAHSLAGQMNVDGSIV